MVDISENFPVGILSKVAPNVSAESSIKIRLFSSASFHNLLKSGTFPRSEGIINAFVLLVIACST